MFPIHLFAINKQIQEKTNNRTTLKKIDYFLALKGKKGL